MSQSDLDHMIRNRLHAYKTLRVDDGISGADMNRPGFQAAVRDIESNPRIKWVLSYRRDRLARPEDALRMATIECDIRKRGVTFVFNNGEAGPIDASNPDLGVMITLVAEYHENGEFLRKLAERVLDTQRLLACEGYSTGGSAPYGFIRVLVDAAGQVVMELVPGRRVRQQGCHVRWRAKDLAKIEVWILVLDLKHQGLGGKKIAQHLNGLGIPSPGAEIVRTDHGIRHRVSGKWCANTVLELCRNAAILGLKEYGHRSEGNHRRLGTEGHRTLVNSDRNKENRAKVIRNDSSLVVRKKTGFESLYDEGKWQKIQQDTAERGKSQRGIPRTSDPAKYPLACRVVDMTDGCGSIMYGHQSGQRRLYTCGRYMRTAGSECDNNSVDAEALLQLTLLTLKQLVNQFDSLKKIRKLLEERVLAE
ncbi:MAG TPA: recombinase family protein, partial [Pirellulales bacterium]|nr:recombinase family protein [Pirellulales bacterium]